VSVSLSLIIFLSGRVPSAAAAPVGECVALDPDREAASLCHALIAHHLDLCDAGLVQCEIAVMIFALEALAKVAEVLIQRPMWFVLGTVFEPA